MPNNSVVLIILDGFGCRAEKSPDNAILKAYTPTFDSLMERNLKTKLTTSGESVGLPSGQMGNSEVGHTTIGTGRIIQQDLTMINTLIDEGSFQDNEVLVNACRQAQEQGSTIHLLGLLSTGGVHSHEDHIEAMIAISDLFKVKKVLLHAFLDGRDVPPQSAQASLERFTRLSTTHTNYSLASLSGRYFAMDRDNNWIRTQAVFDLITGSQSPFSSGTPMEALNAAYQRGETDEFVQPTRLVDSWEMHREDIVIFMNFRADRSRQLAQAFADKTLCSIRRPDWIQSVKTITLTEYSQSLNASVAFPPQKIKNTLGELISAAGLSQLRIAETEKYAHVTFFFNGGVEAALPGENRILIPSPKVKTYDLKPEMSAYELTSNLISAIKEKKYDLIVCNFANGDMVGHTGNLLATIKAIETLDKLIAQILKVGEKTGVCFVITADHGNAEQMLDKESGQPHTAHTTNPVPIWIVGCNNFKATLNQGSLHDIAPTILDIMNIKIPNEMTGSSLFTK